MTSKPFDIVVVGELNPDLILSGDIVPEFGQVEKLVDRATLAIGSSSAIFACGAARLGLRVAFIGKVGDDLFGEFMTDSLRTYGIDTRGVIVDDKVPTGISVILARGADRAILTYPGTIPLLEYSDISTDLLKLARHLHVGSYFIQDRLRSNISKLFDQAHANGQTVSLDTNFDPSGKWEDGLLEVLKKTDIFLPNEVECKRIAKIPDLERALDYLHTMIDYIGVKLGKDGAISIHGSQRYRLKPILVHVVDSVGAGDSFDAGFIYGYLAGWDPERILKMAVVCGSLSTRQAGGTAAQPSLEEAIHYLDDLRVG